MSFEIQGLLGVGGFGMVYRGYDHSLHRPVAIKEYMPTALAGRSADRSVLVRSTADTQSFATGLQSFISEARLLARFDHPSLVKVYRFWESNGTAYMAMPLYQGVTLKEARRRMSGPPPESWLRGVIWSVLSALRVLHENHTLHRDVSPDNIFLQDVGPPVLLDLGAARRAILDQSQKHTAILKVNYAPIEQYADAKDLAEGPWTDLYALAAVMHACLCNESPLPATFRAVRDRMPSVAQIAQTAESHFGQSYSPEFVKALHHALHIEPDGRTQSIDEFIADMGLQAPTDIMAFNWRSALGPEVLLSESGGTHVLTLPQTVAATTVPHRRDIGDRARTRRRDRRDPVAVGAKPQRESSNRSYRTYWLIGLAILFVIVTLVVLRAAHNPEPVAQHDTLAAPIPVQVPSAQNTSEPAPPIAKSPTSVAPSVKAPPAPSVPAAAGSISASKPAVAERSVKLEIAPPPTKGKNSLDELCADSNVLTRPICIYQACQQPQLADSKECVDARERWEQSRKSQSKGQD